MTGEEWLLNHDPLWKPSPPDTDPMTDASDPRFRKWKHREKKRYANVQHVAGLAIDPTRKYCRGALHKVDCQHLSPQFHGIVTKSGTGQMETLAPARKNSRHPMTQEDRGALGHWVKSEWKLDYAFAKELADQGM